ncbi:hypothetical protein GCM10009589_29790 [Arthrobacter pascens]
MPAGYEGITRPLDPRRANADAAKTVRTRINRVLSQKTLQPWFQPIRCLNTGTVIGAEALTLGFTGKTVRQPRSMAEMAH